MAYGTNYDDHKVLIYDFTAFNPRQCRGEEEEDAGGDSQSTKQFTRESIFSLINEFGQSEFWFLAKL